MSRMLTRDEKLARLFVAFWCGSLLLTLVLGVGWVWNIVKIVQTCCEFNLIFIFRVIGVFMVPLGGVMGFL